jgi:predicted unusual protein kinase regulating ubiquinone biosynthesis (AarF/ABC1/UbiB family)
MGFEDLEGLAADAEVFDLLAVPRMYRDYSSGAIRTYERLAGWTLEEVIAGIQTTASSKRPPRSDPLETLGLDADDVARRICLVWLRQALYGSMYPVDVHPGDIVVLSTHQIAFTGGLFATLPPLTRENLFNYLVASAARDPDRAYDGLMREMEETSRARGERVLRNRFRQVVPFRDGPWSQTGDGDTLAEHLLVYWRIAREHGYHVRIPTLDFYRGLFAVTRHVQRLAPARDALKEGLEDLRFSVGISEIREMMDVDLWRDTMNKYATSMLQLPYLLNEVLSKTPGEHLRAPRPSARSTRSIRPVSALMGLLCLLVATAVVARHLTRTLGENVWVQGISTGIFVLAGLLMLRMIYRR